MKIARIWYVVGIVASLCWTIPTLVFAQQLAEFFVSPKGNDKSPGTEQRPWKTVANAIKKVQAFRTENPGIKVQLYFRDGAYPVEEMLSLSGNGSEAPLELVAYPGETPVLTGDVRIKRWKQVTDRTVLNRLAPEVRGKIWQADLKKAGVESFGTTIEREDRLDLYWQGQRQQLARWPNGEFTIAGKALGATTLPPTWLNCHGTKEGVFEYKDARINRWVDEPEACLNGYWYWDWSESFQKVAQIDTVKHQISLEKPDHSYGYRDGFRYYGLNLLCELDAPGEYYVDRDRGILYWYAPEAFDRKSDFVTVSVLSAPYMLSVSNFDNLTLNGLSFRGGRCSAIDVAGGENVRLKDCRIAQFGCDALHLTDGKNHTVEGCLLQELGCSGIVARGGDRKNLDPAGYVVENTIVENFSLFKHTYEPAVLFDGAGLSIRHNLFQGSTSSALRINGNDVLIEYNQFFDLVKESDDQGGMDMWSNPSYRGIVVRYNHWRHIVGGTHNGAAGVRLDDMISGAKVYGNVFEQCGSVIFGAVQIHGGKDNHVENNLFYKCFAAVSFTPWGNRWKNSLELPQKQKELYEDVDISSELYKKRYPELNEDIKAYADRNFVSNNLVVDCDGLFLRENGSNVLQNNSVVTSNTADDVGLDYYLDSALLQRFGLLPIPFESIGPWENRYMETVTNDRE